MLLPYTAKVNSINHLEIGGCDVVSLVSQYGTPLFIYDEKTIRDICREYRSSFEKREKNVEIIYASKAFICQAICRIMKEEGISLDVSSGGEIYNARSVDFPPDKIYLHGNNKIPKELKLALDYGIKYIVVDSDNELDLIEELCTRKKVKQSVLLRITPDVKPTTHSYIQTGQIDSKFGFGLNDDIALKAIKRVISSNNLEFKGLHAHIGSQIFALHSYAKAIEIIVDFVKEIKDKIGVDVNILNVGGGLGIKYQADDEPSSIDEYAEVILSNIKEETEKKDLSLPRIMIEPGRSIVGNAAVTVYTIGTIKEIPNVRTYVSVDGGMSDNLRPMLYDAKYEALLANKAEEKSEIEVTVAGKHCESGDILIENIMLPKLEIGDLLCTPATGAYGYALANNYNEQPRPPVIMVNDGQSRLIIRGETYEDLIRLDQ